MSTLDKTGINILDLPDEILLAISNKLNMVDVLYSLVGVNQRFDQLVLDPFYIHHLDLTDKSLIKTKSSGNNEVLDRICEAILPRINREINKLTVDQHSLERILHAAVYPQLYSLSLVDFQQDNLLPYLIGILFNYNLFYQQNISVISELTIFLYIEGDTKLPHLLTDQITHLNINLNEAIKTELSNENESTIFSSVISMGKCLTDLTFRQWFPNKSESISIFHMPSTSCVSSTLRKLNIEVNTFDDCLYLLDGCFDSLSTLIINIAKISGSLSNIANTKQLPKLKCFSLTSFCRTYFYDNRVVPLLHRMSDLEELTLYLSIVRTESTYIDGTHLSDEILIHMPQLNKFIFNINTVVLNRNISVALPSNNDIQRSFIRRDYQQVGSYIHNISRKKESICHIYSLPYEFDHFLHLNSHFPGGMFDKVRCVIMSDGNPFEHELFQVVSRSFPCLQTLTVLNYQPQQKKQHSSPVVTFPHLISLNLRMANVDYAEQFLCETKTSLPSLLSLTIRYKLLKMATNNFTNDTTRFNCARLRSLVIHGSYVPPDNFHSYFPSCY